MDVVNKCVAFTGYRESKILSQGAQGNLFATASDLSLLEGVAAKTLCVIRELHAQGYRRFLSGMSDGFDLIAAEAVLVLREEFADVELVAVVPFVGQERRFSAANILRYANVLSLADQVVMLSDRYTSKLQYIERNDYLVDHASMLVCYYDGLKGGTQYTYNKARKMGLQIINICEF